MICRVGDGTIFPAPIGLDWNAAGSPVLLMDVVSRYPELGDTRPLLSVRSEPNPSRNIQLTGSYGKKSRNSGAKSTGHHRGSGDAPET